MNLRQLIVALTATLLLASCNDEDFVAPSFLNIDAIRLVRTAMTPFRREEDGKTIL